MLHAVWLLHPEQVLGAICSGGCLSTFEYWVYHITTFSCIQPVSPMSTCKSLFQGNSEYPICVGQLVTFTVLRQITHGSKINAVTTLGWLYWAACNTSLGNYGVRTSECSALNIYHSIIQCNKTVSRDCGKASGRESADWLSPSKCHVEEVWLLFNLSSN